jgi:excisionase family DNA binding protein
VNRPTSTRAPREAPELAEARDLLRRAVELLERVSGEDTSAPSIGSAGAATINEGMRILGIKRTKLNELIRDGVIAKLKIGRRTLLSRSDIERFLNQSVVT